MMKKGEPGCHGTIHSRSWGWFIVLHCHVMLILVVGLTYSLGVLVVRWVEYFGNDVGDVSWVPSLSTAVQLFTSPVAGALSKKFGSRPVAAAGALVSSAGWITSAFANSVPVLLVTCGIMTGFGYGLAYVPSVSLIGQYFERRHALANGIAYVGSGVGLMAMPPLWQVMIDTYGWRGALVIAGAINLNMFATSLLLRPLPPGNVAERPKTADKSRCSGVTRQERRRVKGCRAAKVWRKLASYLNISLFYTNEQFLLMTAAMALNAFGFFTVTVHMIPNAVYLGVPKLEASLLQTVMGVFSLLARLTHGCFVGVTDLLSPVRVYMASTAVCGLAAIFMSIANNYVSLTILAALVGVGSGMFMPLVAVVMKDFVGSEHLPSALGLSFLGMGVGECIGPPVGGWLFDRTKDYTISFCVAGGALLLAAATLLLELPLRRWRRRPRGTRETPRAMPHAKRLCEWDSTSRTSSIYEQCRSSTENVTHL